MPLYECKHCPYKTNDSQDFDRHQNRRFPCYVNKTKVHGNANVDGPEIAKCQHCDKILSSKSSLTRHIKNQHKYIYTNKNISKPSEINITGNQK